METGIVTTVTPMPLHPRNEIEITDGAGRSTLGYALIRMAMWNLLQRRKKRLAVQRLLVEKEFMLGEERAEWK